MPRGVEQNALSNAGTNQATASGALDTLSPMYTRMATAPQGYTPQQLANLDTASQQSTGGAMASAVGQGALASARTNNAGGYQSAVDDAARAAGVTNSQNALGVQNQNTALQLKQQQMGLAGLDSIYGTSTGAGISYLNTADSASQANAANAMNWAKFGYGALQVPGGG